MGALTAVKHALTDTAPLVYPQPTAPTRVIVDVTDVAVGSLGCVECVLQKKLWNFAVSTRSACRGLIYDRQLILPIHAASVRSQNLHELDSGEAK